MVYNLRRGKLWGQILNGRPEISMSPIFQTEPGRGGDRIFAIYPLSFSDLVHFLRFILPVFRVKIADGPPNR